MYHIRTQQHQMYLGLDLNIHSQITGHVKAVYLKSSQCFQRRYKRIYSSNAILNALIRYSLTISIDTVFIANLFIQLYCILNATRFIL